jgi:hypothetical protein
MNRTLLAASYVMLCFTSRAAMQFRLIALLMLSGSEIKRF